MRRAPAASALFRHLRMALAGTVFLAAAVSCSDNLAPKADAALDPSSIHLISVPDSVKEAYYASFAASQEAAGNVVSAVPMHLSASVVASGGSCSGGGSSASYTKPGVDFLPESDPVNAVALPRDADDGFIADMPIGFDFSFYGNSYNKLNVYLNGFVTFGAPVNAPFWTTGGIPLSATPNNMISIAWTDWNPGKVPGSVRYETRGVAPNRRFLLQFRDVPEVSGTGKLNALLVLAEGSNSVTIYTKSFNMTNFSHRMTQGIENVDGTLAEFDSTLTPAGLITPRVRGVFSLANDARRFAPVSTRDEVPPTIVQPADLMAGNDPHLATAVVAVAAPEASDNCSAVTLTSVRSDGVASLDAPYPVGVTTITWTAKDAEGNVATATQKVTVVDIEAPVFGMSAESIIEVNATSPGGAVVSFDDLAVTDNVGVTSRSCEPASGSVFPAGTTSVVCTAADAAGNSSSGSFSVHVIGAHEQIGALIDELREMSLPNGTSQPIINQLRAAYEQTADGSPACKKVSDFLSMVQKKSSNIPPSTVEYVTGEANRILSVMGCVAPAREIVAVTGSFQRSR